MKSLRKTKGQLVQELVDLRPRIAEVEAWETEYEQIKEHLFLQEQILANVAEGIIIVRLRDSTIIYANPKFEEMLGYSKDELIGRHVSILNFPGKVSPREVSKGIVEILKKRGRWEGQLRNMRKDGTGLWCRANMAVFEHPTHGKVAVSVHQDITQHKQLEEALRKNEENFRRSLDNSPLGIRIVTAEGETLYANQAILDIYGYSSVDELKSIPTKVRYTPESYAEHRVRAQKRRRGEYVPPNYEISIVCKDGKIKHLSVFRKELIWDGKTRFQAIHQDITERKELDAKLERSSEQLRNLSNYLQTVRETERTNIAREIHDELGQALTALKMDLFWLHRKLSGRQKVVAEKLGEMLRLTGMTIQIVKRISTELRPGVLDDLGLMPAIEWQAQEFQDRTRIKCKFSTEATDIDVDRNIATVLFRIVQETLTNVARHANATRVRVNLKKKADKLVLTIRDNGKGIAPEHIHHPMSLGLMGMRERANSCGGDLTISGTPNKGTTVTVNVPLNPKGQSL